MPKLIHTKRSKYGATMRLDPRLQLNKKKKTKPSSSAFAVLPSIPVGPAVDAASWGRRGNSNCNTNKPAAKWTADDFAMDLRLGKGHFGNVYRAKNNRKEYVAIKSFDKSKLEAHLLRREVNIQSQ